MVVQERRGLRSGRETNKYYMEKRVPNVQVLSSQCPEAALVLIMTSDDMFPSLAHSIGTALTVGHHLSVIHEMTQLDRVTIIAN